MPGYETQGNDIRTRWLLQQSSWPTQGSTAVVFDNYDETDTEVRLSKESKLPWIVVSIVEGSEEQMCLGDPVRWRNRGVLVNEVFVPMGDGPALADRICDYISSDWRGISLRNMIFRGCNRVRAGSPDGKWYQMIVEVPFQRDEFSSSGGDMAISIPVNVADSSIFELYDWVTPESGLLQLAIADGSQALHVVRPIVGINSSTQVQVATGGALIWPAHGFTVGDRLYVHQSSPGDETNVVSSGWAKPVAVVIDENTLDLVDERLWLV